jgi:ParB-like chromosome segregation protein Spo0J
MKKTKETAQKSQEIGVPELRKFKISALKPAEYNPRVISPSATTALERSISQFGLVDLIVINIRGGKNTIVGGHQRFAVLKKKKVKEVLCVCVDFDEKKEKALNFALNNPAIQGEFIKKIDKYISKLQKEIGDDKELAGMLDMKIKKLKAEIDEEEKGANLPASAFAVICDCESEQQQKEVYDMLIEKGYKCKLTTI